MAFRLTETMKPERWQKLHTLFHSALQRPPTERAEFLDQACDCDKSLRKQVEALLSAHQGAGSFIETPALELEMRSLARECCELMKGRVIGRYKISSTIAIGGMGEVYLAQDMDLGRKVALKLLPAEFTQDEDRGRRFQQEARAASALNHPNIVTIYEIGRDEGRQYIATEFLVGQTLRQRFTGSQTITTGERDNPAIGGISVGEVLKVGMQIAEALAAAHARGIVHRDIKPENIMLVRSSQLLHKETSVKLLDFGIAKLTEETEAPLPAGTTKILLDTHEGFLMGTAVYMSPEQASGARVDARTDIWSLGIVLYEMLSSKQPFGGATVQDIIESIMKDEPPSLLKAPEKLIRIVEKMLRKNRDERYQTMKDVFLDLAAVAEELESNTKEERSALQNSEIEGNPRAIDVMIDRKDRDIESVTGPNGLNRLYQRRARIAFASLLLVALTVTVYLYFTIPHKPPIESIAVLPFFNESGDSDLEYLPDGMTDTLIDTLTKLPHVSVKPRNAVSRYKGRQIDPQQVARELSVQAILIGSVAQHDDDLTINLSLVDGQTGNHLWDKSYHKKRKDLVTLQSEIASDVIQALGVRWSSAEDQRITKNYAVNAEAYSQYLHGRHHLFKLTPSELKKSISCFKKAIELDSLYAPAYVGLAMAFRTASMSFDAPPREVFPQAIAAAQKAVEIDDTLAEAHAVLGFSTYLYDWDWNKAENHFKRAIELNPNSQDSHWGYAHLLSREGRHDEALREIKQAREIEPTSLMINAMEALFLIDAGKPDEALVVVQKIFELEPKFWIGHIVASNAYIEKGMFAQALAEARKARELNKVSPFPIANVGYILARSGKRAEALVELKRLLNAPTGHYIAPTSIALIYNGLGDREKALAWLDRAYYDRDPRLTFLKVEARWNNLRDEPRFQNLLGRIGL